MARKRQSEKHSRRTVRKQRTNGEFDRNVALDGATVGAHVVGTLHELVDLSVRETDLLQRLLVNLFFVFPNEW